MKRIHTSRDIRKLKCSAKGVFWHCEFAFPVERSVRWPRGDTPTVANAIQTVWILPKEHISALHKCINTLIIRRCCSDASVSVRFQKRGAGRQYSLDNTCVSFSCVINMFGCWYVIAYLVLMVYLYLISPCFDMSGVLFGVIDKCLFKGELL